MKSYSFIIFYLLLLLPSSCNNIVEAPTDFGFVIEGFTDKINLYDKTFTRKGIAKKTLKDTTDYIIEYTSFIDTTTTLAVTKQQKDSIYRKFLDLNLLSGKRETVLVSPFGITGGQVPITITYQNGGLSKKVSFYQSFDADTGKILSFRNFSNFVFKMAHRQNAVKNLPKSSLVNY